MDKLQQEIANDVDFGFELFAFMHELAIDGIWYCDPKNPTNFWASTKFWKAIGYLPNEVKPSFKEVLITSSYTQIQHVLKYYNHQTTLKEKGIVGVNHKNGNLLWFSYNLSEVKLKSKDELRSVFAVTDITTSHQKEQILEQCNKVANVGYWEYNPVDDTLLWSQITKQIHEVEPYYEPELKTAINFYKEGSTRMLIKQLIDAAMTTGQSYHQEFEIVTAKGNTKWVKSLGIPEIINGKCVRLSGTFQDVTESKNIALELEVQRQKLERAISATKLAVWEWNVQTGETIFNERWAEILGYTLHELAPISINTWIKLVHPDDLKISNERFDACFKKETDYYECEVRMKHKSGKWVWILDRGQIVKWTDDGKPLIASGTHQEITAQKNKIEEYVYFIKQAPSAIAMLDKEMRYVAHSELWLKEYHLEGKELIGKSHYEIFPEIDDRWKKHHKDCLNGIEQHCDEDKFERKDGSIQYLRWHLKPWYTSNGEIGGIMMLTEDLTQKKQMEERLRIIEDIFDSTFEYSSIGMALASPTYEWVKLNNRFCSILGYTEEELRVLNFKEFTHPDDIELDLKHLSELKAGKTTNFQMEKRYIHKNGSIVNIILAVSQVKDRNGVILYFIVQVVDITPLKNAEEALKAALDKTQHLFDASGDVSIIEVDAKGTICGFNRGAEELLGYTAQEMVNKETPLKIHVPEEINRFIAEVQQQNPEMNLNGLAAFYHDVKPNKPNTREWTYVSKFGELIPVQVTVSRITKNNETIGYLGIAANLTEVKKAEKEIQGLLKTTQNQNARLKNFAHIVSHNLRSHAGNIDSLIEMVSNDNPQLKNSVMFDMLKKAAENLSETIVQLREVAVMNEQATEQLQAINLTHALHNATENVVGLAHDAEVKIINEVTDEVWVLGNTAYIDSVLLNFLTNGIKYRSLQRDSFIQISTQIKDNHLLLSFRDNGLGIDLKTNGSKLFGMYKTFHKHAEARGIGLFITRNQVEAMGGKIEVESELNVGSTFTVFFKLPNT